MKEQDYWKLLSKYRHIKEILDEANPDLARWVYDNIFLPLINKKD